MELLVNSASLLVLIITVLLAMFIYRKIKTKIVITKKINETWGKTPIVKYDTDDMVSIASYYKNKKSKEGNETFLDDITWNDLDLDRVYKRLNCAHSSVGEEYLYNMLRTLVFDENTLNEREEVIKTLNKNPVERKKLQFLLELLGKLRHSDISNYIGDFPQMSVGNVFVYKSLAIINVLVILLTFYNVNFCWLLIISFVTNMLVHYRARKNLDSQLSSIGYVAWVINTSRKITKAKINGLDECMHELEECNKKLSKLGKASNGFSKDSGGDPLTEYIRIVLLTDLNNYNKTLKLLKANQVHYRKLYETIGFLDSMISITSYRESLDYYCQPKLKKKKLNEACYFKTMEVYHPLINEPVPNSIELKKSLLLTGSNASGKSTFLKSLAISAIFAQTIYTCLAKEYKANYFTVLTSMALRDDLSNKESYFIAEIKSLKRILDTLNSDVPCLCFIDEILRGTNTIERIASSSRVLQYLSEANCMSVAATHDVELTSILEAEFENYHFQEKITDDEIVFDYKLYSGKSKTRNAIKLLNLMGFDKKIVEGANKAAIEFERDGTWT